MWHTASSVRSDVCSVLFILVCGPQRDTVLVQAVPKQTKSIQVVVSDGVRLATFLVSSDSAKIIGWGDCMIEPTTSISGSFRLQMGSLVLVTRRTPSLSTNFPPDVVVASTMGCVVVAFVLIIAAAVYAFQDSGSSI